MRGEFMDTVAPGRVVQPREKKEAEQGNHSKKTLLRLANTE